MKTLELEIRRISVSEDEILKQLSNRCEEIRKSLLGLRWK